VKRPIVLATVVGALGLWGAASGESPRPETPVCTMTATECCPRAQLSGCPNDYCRKTPPRIWCLPCGLPDDYCPKPCPRLSVLAPCTLPDDYCPKPCPKPCCTLCADHYTCGRPAPCTAALPARDPPRKTGQEGEPSGYNNGCFRTVSPYPAQ
jgi:hypothetical protein